MPEEQKAGEGQDPEDDGSEDRFFARIQEMIDKANSEDVWDQRIDRWAAKVSAEIDEEEAKGPKKEGAVADGGTEGVQTAPEPTAAERNRASGGAGPGRPSGYWERYGRRILYGNRR